MSEISITLNPNFQVALSSHIEIQGEVVLDMISIERDCAKYQLIGFNKPQYFICDYRKHSLHALKACIKSRQFGEFLDLFNQPALVCIRQQNDKNILLELHDSELGNPKYMMWIAVGIKENIIPNYSFIVKEIVSLKENKALLSIYVRPDGA